QHVGLRQVEPGVLVLGQRLLMVGVPRHLERKLVIGVRDAVFDLLPLAGLLRADCRRETVELIHGFASFPSPYTRSARKTRTVRVSAAERVYGAWKRRARCGTTWWRRSAARGA